MSAVLAGQKSRGGLRFRFSEVNLLTGRAYSLSRFDDLPYCVSLVVEGALGLSDRVWDRLVQVDGAGEFVGGGLFEMPLTVDGPGPLRPETRPAGACNECWGTCVSIDSDGSMTGTVGAGFECACASLSRSRAVA